MAEAEAGANGAVGRAPAVAARVSVKIAFAVEAAGGGVSQRAEGFRLTSLILSGPAQCEAKRWFGVYAKGVVC
jgi:hypothetical protein